ncbi:MAG: glycoside hydrolase family 11 protein [Bacteroidales bacterium]|nr:glycoside hydrolase family 11 protein [Bacteroidales bacterium]
MKNVSYLNLPRLFQNIFVLILVCFNSFLVEGQTLTINEKGTHDGRFYYFWRAESQGSISMTLGADGNYSTKWSNASEFFGGKGWLQGRVDRNVCFSGTFNGGSYALLALYGWTRNETIEYYVLENHGQWNSFSNASDMEYMGSFACDGGTYKIYKRRITRLTINPPHTQYWSIRTQTRSSGTITFSKHVEEWKKYGMNLGSTMDYQIMITEAYQSSGNSNITVCESISPLSIAYAAPYTTTTLSAPAYVNLTATAASTSGSIEKVEFYNGTTKLGEDLSAPYSYTWANVALGTYNLNAVAVDSLGVSIKSEEVSINVLDTPNKVILNKGWNYIGCPLVGSTPIEIALQGVWDKVELVKDNYSYYVNTNLPFLNTLVKLNYGSGYHIKVSESCELNW